MKKSPVCDILLVGRVRSGPYASDHLSGYTGMFIVRGPCGVDLLIISSDGGMGWDHVSVSVKLKKHRRLPTWEEMCFVKSLFWDDEETVMQLHPKKSEYVNFNPWVLHLWKPTKKEIPTPPTYMIGPVTG